MVFSSLIFLFLFLPLTLAAYYLAPRKLRNLVLFIVSLVFYAWGEPVYILIMLFSTVFDYFNGLIIGRYRASKRISQAVLINSLIINLGLLGFFKYWDFFMININNLFNISLPLKNLPLPLGISFYTFQTLSYTIDVYLNKVKVQKNIIDFGAYITMFPQLVAGPIVRYSEIEKELEGRQESLNLFGQGVELFIIGLAKKVLLANNIGLLWDTIKATPIDQISSLSAWLGILAFSFQIYFDFSGYSDMALGLGKMFGFNFMKNFDYPYISRSITEFWRRWHISLGAWFREYVYIPLGGNREGQAKQFRNLLIVWVLTGFWHGANWNFILWGLYYGGFLILEKIFLLDWLEDRPGWIRHIYTLLIVVVGWVFFEFENLGQGLVFIKTMFSVGKAGFIDGDAIYYLYSNGLLFLLLLLSSTGLLGQVFEKIKRKLGRAEKIILPLFYILLVFISTAYLVNESYNPFLYFRF